VILAQKAAAGLADRVRAELPNVLEVQIDEEVPAARHRPGEPPEPVGPVADGPVRGLLAESGVDDARVGNLFAETAGRGHRSPA